MNNLLEIKIEKDGVCFEVKIPANLLSGYDLSQKERLIRSTVELAHEQMIRLKV